jgi:hypothetical protein
VDMDVYSVYEAKARLDTTDRTVAFAWPHDWPHSVDRPRPHRHP